jgi:hypothetical protein
VLRSWAPALAVYAAIRVVGFTVMAVLTPHVTLQQRHWTLSYLIGSWDGKWFARIAQHGYDLTTIHHPEEWKHAATFGWFPGYPAAIDAVRWVPGLSIVDAGLLVTLVAGLAAAWGIMALGIELTGDRRVGLVLAALWAAAPGSLALQLVYSEALFCALAAWALVALARRRWLTAALLTCLAGTVRNTAMALVAAVAVAALVQLVRTRDDWWRPAVAAAIAPLGLLGYWIFVAWATHRVSGWFWVEKNLNGIPFDWGRYTLRELRVVLLGQGGEWLTLVQLVVVGAVVLLLWSFAERLPAWAHTYSVVVVVAAVGSGWYDGAKPRFLLPGFLLAVPVARLLARTRPAVLIPLIALLAAASTWFGFLMMTTGGLAP